MPLIDVPSAGVVIAALREDVRIVGRLTLGEDASGGSFESDVMLGDGRRFRVEADAR